MSVWIQLHNPSNSIISMPHCTMKLPSFLSRLRISDHKSMLFPLIWSHGFLILNCYMLSILILVILMRKLPSGVRCPIGNLHTVATASIASAVGVDHCYHFHLRRCWSAAAAGHGHRSLGHFTFGAEGGILLVFGVIFYVEVGGYHKVGRFRRISGLILHKLTLRRVLG